MNFFRYFETFQKCLHHIAALNNNLSRFDSQLSSFLLNQ